VKDLRRAAEDVGVVELAELAEDQDRREDQPDVAEDVDHERLHPRRGRGGAPIPEADQRVGGEADERPADDQQHEVAGQDQQQHREDEEVEEAEEAGVAPVGVHVGDRVEVDQRRDPRDDEDHEHRQRVDEDVELDIQPGGVGVGPQRRAELAPRVGVVQKREQHLHLAHPEQPAGPQVDADRRGESEPE